MIYRYISITYFVIFNVIKTYILNRVGGPWYSFVKTKYSPVVRVCVDWRAWKYILVNQNAYSIIKGSRKPGSLKFLNLIPHQNLKLNKIIGFCAMEFHILRISNYWNKLNIFKYITVKKKLIFNVDIGNQMNALKLKKKKK